MAPYEKHGVEPKANNVSSTDNVTSCTWESLKQEGSPHYKTGKVEPIDLYKAVKPHDSLNALEIKALTDNIKYSFRMLQRGITKSDIDKVIHYSRLAKCSYEEKL